MNQVRARVSFKVGKNSDIPAELATFTAFDKDKEHIAIIFKEADKQAGNSLSAYAL